MSSGSRATHAWVPAFEDFRARVWFRVLGWRSGWNSSKGGRVGWYPSKDKRVGGYPSKGQRVG